MKKEHPRSLIDTVDDILGDAYDGAVRYVLNNADSYGDCDSAFKIEKLSKDRNRASDILRKLHDRIMKAEGIDDNPAPEWIKNEQGG